MTRAAEQAAQLAGFDLAAALREHDKSSIPPVNSPPSATPRPYTKDYNVMPEYSKALDQDNLELRSVGGRSSDNHTSLSEIPKTTASTIATNATNTTNATTLILEEMKRERKDMATQMNQLTTILLAAATKKTYSRHPPPPPLPSASSTTRPPPAESAILPQKM